MSEFVAHTNGDVKEAFERAEEAQARQREHLVKKFNGDKDAADKYMARKYGNQRRVRV